jgi:hypothetical protein
MSASFKAPRSSEGRAYHRAALSADNVVIEENDPRPLCLQDQMTIYFSFGHLPAAARGRTWARMVWHPVRLKLS